MQTLLIYVSSVFWLPLATELQHVDWTFVWLFYNSSSNDKEAAEQKTISSGP